MKKININSEKWEKILELHYDYCVSKLPHDSSLTDEDKKLLFIEYPFNKKMKIKYQYLPLRKNDFSNEYEKFAKYKKEWCRYKLVEALEVLVCPYCGQQYSATVKKQDKVIAEAELDHYARKARYPFLALNIYNLIPVCKNCNQSFKGESDKKIINPYKYSLEDVIKFSIEDAEINNYMNDDKITLYLKNNLSREHELFDFVENHKEVLSLKNRYEFYQSIIKSLIYKKVVYNNINIEDLLKIVNENGNLLSKQELENMLLYQDVFSKNEPFTKFKKDIWEQLDNLDI